jgi:tetratricopeptide (TPR) repeat protein
MANQLHRWLILCVLGLAACSPKAMIVGQITDLVDNGITAYERDADLDFMEKAIPANIKLLEAMLANSPDDRQLMTVLSRLYGSYAFGFVETRFEEALYGVHLSDTEARERDALEGQVNRYYEKGVGYALMALEKSVPGATEAFQKVTTITPYLDRLGREEVAPLFWYGFNLGAWVNHNLDSVTAISHAHVARAVMERVLELDPAYNHGGAHLFLLAYFGSRSPMMGGNQEKALVHYQQVKTIAGDNYLLADLFYGRFCLHQQQDREGFVDTMQRIANHPAGESEVSLYNAIAGRRATVYLAAVDILFE